MNRIALVIVTLVFCASSSAKTCISDKLIQPKLILTGIDAGENSNAEAGAYDYAIEQLESYAQQSTSGEEEFYKAAVEYRSNLQTAFRLSLTFSVEKQYYLSAVIIGLGHEHGVMGYEQDMNLAMNYYKKFEEYAALCNEPYAKSLNLPTAKHFVAKLFGLKVNSL